MAKRPPLLVLVGLSSYIGTTWSPLFLLLRQDSGMRLDILLTTHLKLMKILRSAVLNSSLWQTRPRAPKPFPSLSLNP